jgi:hypothetical protein
MITPAYGGANKSFNSAALEAKAVRDGRSCSRDHCFDEIFGQRTRYKELGHLLARLHRRKHELLKVLERPEIPPTPMPPKTTCGPA